MVVTATSEGTAGCSRAKPGADALAALKAICLSNKKKIRALQTRPRAARGARGEGLAPADGEEPSISDRAAQLRGKNINIKSVASFEMKRLNKPLSAAERDRQSGRRGFARVPRPRSPRLRTGCDGAAMALSGPPYPEQPLSRSPLSVREFLLEQTALLRLSLPWGIVVGH